MDAKQIIEKLREKSEMYKIMATGFLKEGNTEDEIIAMQKFLAYTEIADLIESWEFNSKEENANLRHLVAI